MIAQMKLREKLRIGAAVLVAISLIPIPYLASPEWTVTVTDETGHSLPGMLVRLSYENYSVENSDHGIDLTTDAGGRVVFPAQKRTALIMSRCYYTTMSAMALAHASFGPSAYVLVFGGGREGSVNSSDGSVYFWTGHPDRVTSTIVARPRE
jgi:hypothetical protein